MDPTGIFPKRIFPLRILRSNVDIQYWENYYKNKCQPFPRSDFARFVSQFLINGDSLIDCGCGDARDSLFFQDIGLKVTAIDQCSSLISSLRENFDGIEFKVADFSSFDEQCKWDNVYSRFTLHSITEEQEDAFLSWCCSGSSKYVFIEARSDLNGDADTSTHYRRNINLNRLKEKLEKQFTFVFSAESDYFSPLSAEYLSNDKKNPIILRLVAKRF